MTQQAAVLHLYDYQTSCIAASYQDKNHCVFHHWHTMLHKDPLCIHSFFLPNGIRCSGHSYCYYYDHSQPSYLYASDRYHSGSTELYLPLLTQRSYSPGFSADYCCHASDYVFLYYTSRYLLHFLLLSCG